MGAAPEVCGCHVIFRPRVRASGLRRLRGGRVELAKCFGGGNAEEGGRFGGTGGNLSPGGTTDGGRRHVGGGAKETVLQGEPGEARPGDRGLGPGSGDRGRAELAPPGLAGKRRPVFRLCRGTGCAHLGGSEKALEGRLVDFTARGLPSLMT